MSFTPQLVSRRLRAAGHQLVYPDRRRDGVSVSRWSSDQVLIRIAFSEPRTDLCMIAAELISTCVTFDWYVHRIEMSPGRTYGTITIMKEEP